MCQIARCDRAICHHRVRYGSDQLRVSRVAERSTSQENPQSYQVEHYLRPNTP